MYIQMVSLHGLVRADNVEMGRDADTGGQIRYVADLVKTLSTFDAVDRVDLFTRKIIDKRVSKDYGEDIEHINKKARIVRLPCGGNRYLRKEQLWPYLDDYVDNMLSFTIREGRTPTVIHGHYADAGYVAKEVASAFDVPFVFTGHSLGRDKLAYLESQGVTQAQADKLYRIMLRIDTEEACLAESQMVVASTSHEREEQYSRYQHGNVPRFEIIPPGVSLEKFFPYYDYELSFGNIGDNYKQARIKMTDELRRFHFQPDKPLILALCRPNKKKNVGILVEAYGRDKELQALANLAIFAGIRSNIEEMEEEEQAVLTEILLMMDRYDLYGKIAVPKQHDSDTDVPELYRIAATQRGVFVNTAYVEPFGLTFIEASAVGLPFVGTNNGGAKDIVSNCDSGILLDVEDTAKIQSTLKTLLTDRDQWDSFSNNGINKVREFYAWEAHCESYLEVVGELVRESSEAADATAAASAKFAPGRRLSSLEKILITDIDNTLLGDDKALKDLTAILEWSHDRMGFGVASGRSLELILPVLEDAGVRDLIDIIVSSVGCEIYYGAKCDPDKGWANHLGRKWYPDRIREVMGELPFLELQTGVGSQRDFKISYDLDDGEDPELALPIVHEKLNTANLPCSLVFSHGAFLDLLPYRASKGKAVRYLSRKWGIPMNDIATAGDSGNDRDMLVGQTSGIVVGNYDEELESLRTSGTRVYFAKADCAAGIIEGLRNYKFIE